MAMDGGTVLQAFKHTGKTNGPLWIPAWQLHDRDPTLIMWKVSFYQTAGV